MMYWMGNNSYGLVLVFELNCSWILFVSILLTIVSLLYRRHGHFWDESLAILVLIGGKIYQSAV